MERALRGLPALRRALLLGGRCASRLPNSPSARDACSPALRACSTLANPKQPAQGFIHAAPRERTLIEELDKLENESPWWKASILRVAGTFTSEQRQAAAGGDLYFLCGTQAKQPYFCDPALGGLHDRFYIRFLLTVLHCWICHVRLRQEEKASYEVLFKELMEKVWGQAEIDLAYQYEMGFLQISKHLKEMQFSWHGTARALDSSLDAKHTPEESREALRATLLRNFYTDAEGQPLEGAEPGAVHPAQHLDHDP